MIPYLLDRKIATIDYAIISHFDTDHYQGCAKIMKELKVKAVVISKQGETSENYEEFKKIVNDKKIKVLVVGKGDRIKIENNLYFDILWPNNSKLISENVLNNNSIVCKLYYKNFSMLFTGDIEKEAEEKLIQEYKKTKILKSTVLKVPHHGSKTSSTLDFLKQISPTSCLIGVGKNNIYKHPNQEVLKRLELLRYRYL